MDQAEIAYRELVNTDNAALAKHVEKIQGLEGVLHTMFTPAQVCERVNAVHDELVTKLSHERRELETVQKLLDQARQERDHYAVQVEKLTNERDEARLSRQALMLEHRGVKNLNRAQGDRIAELRAVGPALDILADMVKETQAKLEVAHQQKDELDADYGKLVGEYEDISKHFDLLRNLILDCKLDADDRYGSFGRAMRVDRKEAKMAIHTLVASHPLCVDLQQQVDTLIKRTETEGRRITNAELLHQFPHKAQMVLDAADNCTRHALSSLQYGQTHHCLARLREAVLEYQKFLTKSGRRRDDQG
jgi:chromosome segregation ATPase